MLFGGRSKGRKKKLQKPKSKLDKLKNKVTDPNAKGVLSTVHGLITLLYRGENLYFIVCLLFTVKLVL